MFLELATFPELEKFHALCRWGTPQQVREFKRELARAILREGQRQGGVHWQECVEAIHQAMDDGWELLRARFAADCEEE